MAIIRRHSWTLQPPTLQLDRASSLTHGLQLLMTSIGGVPRDAVNPGRVWTRIGNAATASTPSGLSVAFDGTDDALSHTGYGEIVGNVGTFFIWADRVGAEDANGHVLFGTNTSTNTYWHVVTGPGGGQLWSWGQVSSGFIFSAAWFNTRRKSIVATSAGTAASMRAYVDGVDTGATWSSTPNAFAASSKFLEVGRWVGGNTWDTNADVIVVGYSARPWSAGEARAFHRNPHAFFARRIWIPVAAAAPTLPTLTALTPASITATTAVQRYQRA